MAYTKGRLVRWLGNKGFGFIKPEHGKGDIFIHISAFTGAKRKPIVGDIIHYEISKDSNGKSRAINASIEGIEHVQRRTHNSAYKQASEVKKPFKTGKLLLVLIIIILGVVVNVFNGNSVDSIFTQPEGVEKTDNSANNQRLIRAYNNQQSDVQLAGVGTVIRILADDTEGSQHQRFILKIASNQTVLIAHNIDLAPRINSLRQGDRVEFYGEYEWNSKGGVLHWTHHDPRGRHKGGWLKHNGSVYQ